MSRKTSLPQSRRHIPVFDEDWEYLTMVFGGESDSKVGVGPAIRTMVHATVGNLRARAQAQIDQQALQAKSESEMTK